MHSNGLDKSAATNITRDATIAHPRNSNASVGIAAVLFVFIVCISALADAGAQTALFDAIRNTPYGDKVCHFLLFGVLAFFVNRAFAFRTWSVLGVQVPVGPALVLALATLEELSQRYFPERTLDLVDWLADFFGVASFTWVSHALQVRSSMRR